MTVPYYTSLNVGVDVPDLKDTVKEPGVFKHLVTVREGNKYLCIYVFKFAHGKGCREVTSLFHRTLPPCADKLITDKDLLSLKGDGKLGTSYFYLNEGDEPTVKYTDDGYILECVPSTSSLRGNHSQEDLRGNQFIKAVHLYLKSSNIDLKFTTKSDAMLRAEAKVSPFSGGGDNVLLGWPLAKTLVVNVIEDSGEEIVQDSSCEQSGNGSSPADTGEQRLATNIELKDLTTQSDDAVEQQLKANMHLLSSSLAVGKLKELKNIHRPIAWLNDLKTFTSYGLSFGIVKPVVILKLSIDFCNERLIYEKRYESTMDVHKAPRLACAMQYLIKRMISPSPEPEGSQPED